MSEYPPAPGKRPYLAFTSLALFASMFVTPFVGYVVTSTAIDNTPRDGQNYGLLIAAVFGVFSVAVAIGLAGFGAMVTGGASLARGERARWAALLSAVGGGLASMTVSAIALTLYLA